MGRRAALLLAAVLQLEGCSGLWYAGEPSPDVSEADPDGNSLRYHCVADHSEPAGTFGNNQKICFYSLQSVSAFPPPDTTQAAFDSIAGARSRCEDTSVASSSVSSPDAQPHRTALASPFNALRNAAASKVVSAVGSPHWINALNEAKDHIQWQDGSPSSSYRPWDAASNQPNDCDGPESPETCVFLGPFGAWFDFACQPKDPAKLTNIMNGMPADPAPVVLWEDGSREPHNIYSLCQLVLPKDANVESVVFGWMPDPAPPAPPVAQINEDGPPADPEVEASLETEPVDL